MSTESTTTTPVPVHDVSVSVLGSGFQAGVNNFCIHTALEAMRSIKVVSRDDLSAMVNVLVYDNLYASGQIDRYNDKLVWRNFSITIDPASTFDGPVVDSVLSDSKGNKVILRTHEY